MTTHTVTTGDSAQDRAFPHPGRSRAQIASGAGGRFALAGAKSERQLPARYGPAPEVPRRRRSAEKERAPAHGVNARRGRRVPVTTPREGRR
ncbi:hypothetical protein HDC93_006073 [Streptomyces sp. AK010]|nr:hypothetical protein [Streptomyces sp. AK010]